MGLKMIDRMSLTQKFIAGSLFATVVTGVVTGVVLVDKVRDRFFDEFARRTVIAQRTVSAHDLKASDFAPASTRLRSKEFDQMMRRAVIGVDEDIKLIKIWRNDGTILYSNNRSLIGEKNELSRDLKRVFAGQVVFEPSTEESQIEVYSPIEFDGAVVGAFETYFPLDAATAAVRRTAITITILLGCGLAFLWAGLSWLVKGTAATIDRQNKRLRRANTRQSETIKELQESHLGTIRALAATVEARDPYTNGHAMRVTHLAYLLGKEYGLDRQELRRLQRAAALHDIGKIGAPDRVLLKPGRLTESEWKEIRKHPDIGAGIVAATPYLQDIAEIIRRHHERFDGHGYPKRLGGDGIPVAARILAIVDAFDAMTSDRPYRLAFALDEAVERIVRGSGSQFDPQAATAFIELCRREPGTLSKVLGGQDSPDRNELKRLFAANF